MDLCTNGKEKPTPQENKTLSVRHAVNYAAIRVVADALNRITASHGRVVNGFLQTESEDWVLSQDPETLVRAVARWAEDSGVWEQKDV